MKFIAKALVLVFVIAFPMYGRCIITKTEFFKDHKNIANNVLALLLAKNIVEEDNEYVAGYDENTIKLQEIGLAYDAQTDRYLVDLMDTGFREYGYGAKFFGGEMFEYKNKKLISLGIYGTANPRLFDNKYVNTNSNRIIEIFSIM